VKNAVTCFARCNSRCSSSALVKTTVKNHVRRSVNYSVRRHEPALAQLEEILRLTGAES
jgi:hypothetical protein